MPDSPSNKELPNDSIQVPAADLVDKFEWIKFNLGGELLETTRASIDKLKSEFFALLLDSDMYEPPAHEVGGAVYRIDRDPDALKVFFNYGRYGKVVSIPDHISETFLLEEGLFYKIDEKVLEDIQNFFQERRTGPSNVHLDKVSITEMAMDKRLMHHNVYGIIRGSEIYCYTNIPGHGTCHADVRSNFLLEKPREKYPALLRVSCSRCGHKICMADDALIGLEGWCHKCRLCLRCQDILCEVDNENLTEYSASRKGTKIVKKTARAVFVYEEASPHIIPGKLSLPEGEAIFDDGSESSSRDSTLLQGQRNRKSVVDDSLKLPKLPKLKLSRDPTQQYFPAIKPNLRRSSLPARTSLDSVKTFEDFLASGKW